MTVKTLEYRFKELKNSLEAIENANNDFCQTGKESYLLTIIGQCRVLAGSGERNMHPLLINLMNDLEIYPIFYSFPPKTILDNPDSNSNKDSLVGHFYLNRTWYVDDSAKSPLFETHLKPWMMTPYQFMDISKRRKFYTRNDILRGVSDKHGGGHYDPDISEYVEYLERISSSNNLNGVKIFLLDVASAIVYTGEQLINIYEANRLNKNYNNDQRYLLTKNKFRNFNFGYFPSEIQVFGEYIKQ